MNKLLLYIVLLGSPLCVSATIAQDSVDTIVFKPVAAEETLYHKERKFNEGFKDSYSDAEFQYETKTAAKSQWQCFKEWLAAWLDRIFSGGNGSGSSFTLTIIARIIAFLLLGLIAYFIVRAILNKEGYWIFGRAGKKIAMQDIAEENIHEMDFGKLVTETKQSGNYRLAVRYYYLWVLKKLSSREVIEWNWDKTNSDYLYEIRDKALKKDFEYLSYVYDYSWYGDFPINEKAFEKAERAFQKTLNTL